MNREDRIWREALRPLAEETPEAAREIESRLLAEFHKHRPTRRTLWKPFAWTAGAAAVAAMAIVGFQMSIPRHAAPPARKITAAPAPEVAATVPAPVTVARVVKRRPRHRARGSAVESSATAFFPLPYAAIPAENIQVLRVSLPRSSLSVLGLPVRPDRMFEPVQADVAVGEDGIARAIRFVPSQNPF